MDVLADVSCETRDQLEAYVGLLLKWTKAINLIGESTEGDIWSRHIADAAQVVSYISPHVKTLLDMGSGAGLPGMVIAILRPDITVTLSERDGRKSAFLQEAAARLELSNIHVSCETVERHQGQYDCITARALAPLSKLCHYAYPLMKKDTICLFAKGENYANEIHEAEAEWAFSYTLQPSAIQERSVIISLTELMSKNPIASKGLAL